MVLILPLPRWGVLSGKPRCMCRRRRLFRAARVMYLVPKILSDQSNAFFQSLGGGGGSRTFPQLLFSVRYKFYKGNEVPKGPLCRGNRTRIVHGTNFL